MEMLWEGGTVLCPPTHTLPHPTSSYPHLRLVWVTPKFWLHSLTFASERSESFY